jgi:hypothetical protein
MESAAPDIPASRIERFFEALLARDGAGGSWLGPLLGAAPRGRERFGELAERPGWLEAPLAVVTETGRRGAFEYPAVPSRQLLAWLIDNPERLTRPNGEQTTSEARRLRRALLDDDPPGARRRAQDRAHDLLRSSAPFTPAWWRFEDARIIDCLLMTDRLVLLVHGSDGAAAPPTPWFPERTSLVRDLEAARRYGEAGKAWGVLVLGAAQEREEDEVLLREVAAGAPHLGEEERRDLADGYLGALSWQEAAAAVDLTDL